MQRAALLRSAAVQLLLLWQTARIVLIDCPAGWGEDPAAACHSWLRWGLLMCTVTLRAEHNSKAHALRARLHSMLCVLWLWL